MHQYCGSLFCWKLTTYQCLLFPKCMWRFLIETRVKHGIFRNISEWKGWPFQYGWMFRWSNLITMKLSIICPINCGVFFTSFWISCRITLPTWKDNKLIYFPFWISLRRNSLWITYSVLDMQIIKIMQFEDFLLHQHIAHCQIWI